MVEEFNTSFQKLEVVHKFIMQQERDYISTCFAKLEDVRIFIVHEKLTTV